MQAVRAAAAGGAPPAAGKPLVWLPLVRHWAALVLGCVEVLGWLLEL